MKEPWEVYYESFKHGGAGIDWKARPWKTDPEIGRQAFLAFDKARESSAYHLIDALKWKVPVAQALMGEFFDEAIAWFKEESDQGPVRLKERLKNRWTDWCLRKGRTA